MQIFSYDPDYKKEPKTETYCCHCQKDIKRVESAYKVWIDIDSFRLSFYKPTTKALAKEGWVKALLGNSCKKHLRIDNRVFK